MGDWSQLYIADRWPGHVLNEPMVHGVGSGNPTGQRGWLYVFRINVGVTSTGAWRVLRLT